MSGRLTVLPSPSLCAAPAGSQGGGLGQRARTWQFQGCLMPGPGLSEADYCTHTHTHTFTTGPGDGAPSGRRVPGLRGSSRAPQ